VGLSFTINWLTTVFSIVVAYKNKSAAAQAAALKRLI